VTGALPALGWAQEPLDLLTGETKQTVSVSQIPRPASKIAENVSVITADDIVRLNAHTLAEVLHSVPGIQLDPERSPGSWTMFTVNGFSSGDSHILVLIDGVPQNFLTANGGSALTGLIPVQQIERVEIIKGAASAAWGQALGGVVNVITKSPDPERPYGGLVSGSVGSRFTADSRGELTGTVGRFGYYLTGGNLHSDGLNIGNGTNLDHTFGKFTYDLPGKGTFTLGLDYRAASYGLDHLDPPLDYHDTGGNDFASVYLNFRYPLADRLTLEFLGRVGEKKQWTKWGVASGPDLMWDAKAREEERGATLKLHWGDSQRNLVAGLEYSHSTAVVNEPIKLNPLSNYDRSFDQYSAYLNGAYSIGPLTVLPGVRFDKTAFEDNALSYTLGATCQLTDKTLLRGYGARGFGLPIVNGVDRLQKVWTVQAGIETAEIPYLWLKGTLFRSDTWQDFEDFRPSRRGFELEARTTPLYGLFLTGGYTYADVRIHDTNEPLAWIPTNGAKVALNYDNTHLGLRGALTGNYVRWPSSTNTASGTALVKEGGLVWDLNLTQQLMPGRELSPELFFSARNLFDVKQFTSFLYPNNPRWFEGGLRFKF
jgi:vitamin B12 transporter